MSSPSPFWFASRGAGIVLLLVLTATVVLGIVTSRRWRGDEWPRFLTAGLHRNLSLLALALLPLHGLTVVLDSYARLGLVDVLVPFASAYRPLWLGLGVLAGELLLAQVAVSLVRQRLGYRLWRITHWGAYAVWPLAVLHGLGTGSDTTAGWSLAVYAACLVAVLVALLVRLSLDQAGPRGWQVAAGLLAATGALAIVLFAILGPLQPGWALTAGTPRDLIGSLQAPADPQPSPSPPEAP